MGRACRVHGGITTANDQHPVTQARADPPHAIRPFRLGYGFQEPKRGEHTLATHALDAQHGVLLEAGGDIDRVETVVQQRLRWIGHAMTQLDLDAHSRDPVDVLLDNGRRQPEVGGNGQHAARHLPGLKDGYLDPVQRQEIGGGET